MRKKGFTLVELLAVISILAILIIVAMPKIISTFFTSQEKTFSVEIGSILDTAKTTFIKDTMFNPDRKLYCNTADCEGTKLDMNMSDDLKYSIKLNRHGEVMCFQATNGTFYYVRQGDVDKENIGLDVFYTSEKTSDFVPDCTYSVNYKNIERINVLNIYPDRTEGSYAISTNAGSYNYCTKYKQLKSSSLKNWMETSTAEAPDGYGKGIIKVIPVSFTDYQSNPNPDYWVKQYYDNGCITEKEGEEALNKTKADLILMGTWDGNGNVEYNDNTIASLENWAKSGKPIIAGHDVLITVLANSTKLVNSLKDEFGIELVSSSSATSNKVHILSNKKRNVFTSWPWLIMNGGENGVDGLTIPPTHSTGQMIKKGEVWITLGATKLTEEQAKNNNFYLSTYNNTAIIQTGHSNAAATEDEQKIVANTIFFMYYKHVLKESGDDL